jgi:beta-mannanase
MGVYQGNGCDGVTQLTNFTNWFGRKTDHVIDFFAADSWDGMLGDAGWAIKCWAATKTNVIFSIPMLPQNGPTLAQGAAGAYDDYFRQLAAMLVQNGYGNAIIRLGWEANGGWYAWNANQDPANWVKYFQRIVTTMRAVAGTSFRFDWCVAQGYQQIGAEQFYPGDQYVDIIGLDIYNQTWTTGITTPEQRWNELMTMNYGLKWHRDFAAAHKKGMSFPEWGTGTRPDGAGGGDDDYFITQMAKWIGTTDPVYHNYWDYPAADFNAKISDGSKPKAAAAFKKSFFPVPRAPGDVRG